MSELNFVSLNTDKNAAPFYSVSSVENRVIKGHIRWNKSMKAMAFIADPHIFFSAQELLEVSNFIVSLNEKAKT